MAAIPDGAGFALKAKLSARLGVAASQIVLGNGSNDVLDIVARAFLAPGTSSVHSEHAFAVYPIATQTAGAEGIVVPARDYGHDLEAMRAAIRDDTRVVWIANPNNPTGTFLPWAEIEASSRACRPRCWWCWTRPTANTCPKPTIAATRCRLAGEIPQSAHHPHLLQGLWPGRPAGRLRPVAARRDRSAQPRAPALQRQQPAQAAALAALDDASTWRDPDPAEPRPTPAPLARVRALWQACGAEVLEMDVERHDQVLAAHQPPAAPAGLLAGGYPGAPGRAPGDLPLRRRRLSRLHPHRRQRPGDVARHLHRQPRRRAGSLDDFEAGVAGGAPWSAATAMPCWPSSTGQPCATPLLRLPAEQTSYQAEYQMQQTRQAALPGHAPAAA
jgi:hypothetical protein